MNSPLVANPGPEPPEEIALERSSIDSRKRTNTVETWLTTHTDMVASVVVAAGFILRFLPASRSYLNPDELLHYLMIHQPSAYLAYKASLTNAHPPLFYQAVYVTHFLGSSELILRLPSVLAGTAFCWFFYKWVGAILGNAAALIGVVVVAFCPALIALSAEVREYALLLFCMAAALYYLEQAIQNKSVREMWVFSVFLYLAILTHYSAIFFALTVGVYSLARFADSRLPRNVLAAWICGQAGALAIYAILYVTQVSKLKYAISVWSTPFDQAYFRLDRESIFAFTQRNTSAIFRFLFQQPRVAEAMFIFFVMGVAFLFIRDLFSRGGDFSPRHLGLLLILPFISLWGASIAGEYPYVGTRHTALLAPFAAAAASYFIAGVTRKKLWAGLLVASLIMALSNSSATATEPGISKENESRDLMTAAMNYIQQTVPKGDVILADAQANMTLEYYLCGPVSGIAPDAYYEELGKYDCAGYSIVRVQAWKLIPASLEPQFKTMAGTYDLKPGGRVWLFQAGWGDNFDKTLPKSSVAFRCAVPKSFGENLAIVPLEVGRDSTPVAPSPGC